MNASKPILHAKEIVPERLAVFAKKYQSIDIFTTVNTSGSFHCETREQAKRLIEHYGSKYCTHRIVNYK